MTAHILGSTRVTHKLIYVTLSRFLGLICLNSFIINVPPPSSVPVFPPFPLLLFRVFFLDKGFFHVDLVIYVYNPHGNVKERKKSERKVDLIDLRK